MKACTPLLFAAMLAASSLAAENTAFRQTYPAAPESTVKKIEAELARTTPEGWKDASLAYYTVPALSDVRRMPNAYPTDGVPFGTFRITAAQGEYEPASAVFFPRKNIDRFLPKAGELRSAEGAVIPASALDIKLVKVWYQAGSAWYSQMNDNLKHVLVPEMLLNDENMIFADTEKEENYVRYSNIDGSVSYQWMTANFSAVNYVFHENRANIALILDAPELQPAVLNKHELKQYMFTLHVPEDAKPGVYTGRILLTAEGKDAGFIPVRVRVLPFRLPQPKTYYNQEKGFYLSGYNMPCAGKPRIARNLAAHNALNPMEFPMIDVLHPERFAEDIRLAKETGLNTRPLFSGAHHSGLMFSPDPKGKELKELENLERIIQETREICLKELGHTDFYCYGVDEGSPATIRKERAAWRAVHKAGGKIQVTTHPKGELLFALDYIGIPGAPSKEKAQDVDKFHESHPDGLCYWYADPHSGPENPDFARRLHGIQAWKRNYDVISNYSWWRNNWNDSAIPYGEAGYRGIILVYLGCEQVFDTLAWEGVREALDDVRYASYLKQLALEAQKNPDGDILLLGRRALGFLAYSDEEREPMNAFRLECINYILTLRKALGKGN